MRTLLEKIRDLAELLYKKDKAEDPQASRKEIATAARKALRTLEELESADLKLERGILEGTREVLMTVLKASGSRDGDQGDLGVATSCVVRLLAYLEGQQVQVDRREAKARQEGAARPGPESELSGEEALLRVGSIPTLVWMRRKLLLAILGCLIPIGFLFFQIIPRHYEAVVLLGQGGEAAPQGEGNLDWEVTNLTPLALAQLTELPKTHALLEEELGKINATPALAQAQYDAIVKRGVNAIKVSATHPRAKDAALVANVLTEVLLERNRVFLKDQILGSVATLNDRAKREKRNLEKLDIRIRELEERHDLRFMDRSIQTALAEVASLGRQVLVSQNEWEYVANEIKILEGRARKRDKLLKRKKATPAVPKSGNPATPPEIEELLRRREELLLGFKPEHPLVTSLDRRIALLHRRHQAELARRGKLPVQTPTESADEPDEIDLSLAEHRRRLASVEEKIKGLRKMEGQWRGRIRTMNEAAPILSRLKEDRQVAAAKVETLDDRLANLDEQANHPSGHFKIMEQAGVPTEAIPALPPIVVASGVFTLWILAALIILATDMHRRRIITAEDGQEALGTRSYEAFQLADADEQTTRAFFDRLIQAILEEKPETRSIAIVGVDRESEAREMWEHLGGASSRLGRKTALFDLSEEEGDEELGLPAPLSFWLGHGPARMGVMLLPDLRAGSRAAKLAEGVDEIVVVARTRRHNAEEMAFWMDTLPGGRGAIGALVLSGDELHTCVGAESLVLSMDDLEDPTVVENEEKGWWTSTPRAPP